MFCVVLQLWEIVLLTLLLFGKLAIACFSATNYNHDHINYSVNLLVGIDCKKLIDFTKIPDRDLTIRSNVIRKCHV